jgi:hypothetical protein
MSKLVEAHDYSNLKQRLEPVNVHPKRSVSEIVRPQALSDLATDITKLIPAVQSRLMEIAFEVAPDRRQEVRKRIMERYENMLSANGYMFDKVRLEQIIKTNFPDLRSTANNVEFEFG